MAFESARQVLDTATALRRSADAADERLGELLAGGLSSGEFEKINRQIDKLYSAVRDLTSEAEELIIEGMNLTQTSLIDTIDGAKAEIKKIQDIKKFFQVLASLIGFIGVAMSGQPTAIIGAVGGIRDAVNT